MECTEQVGRVTSVLPCSDCCMGIPRGLDGMHRTSRKGDISVTLL